MFFFTFRLYFFFYPYFVSIYVYLNTHFDISMKKRCINCYYNPYSLSPLLRSSTHLLSFSKDFRFSLLVFCFLINRYGFDKDGNSRRGDTRNANNSTPFGSERFNSKGYDWEGKGGQNSFSFLQYLQNSLKRMEKIKVDAIFA